MHDALEIRDLTGMEEQTLPSLRASLARVHTLDDVIAWARSQQPKVAIDEIVTQDEYTHDVLVSLGAQWLAFDVT